MTKLSDGLVQLKHLGEGFEIDEVNKKIHASASGEVVSSAPFSGKGNATKPLKLDFDEDHFVIKNGKLAVDVAKIATMTAVPAERYTIKTKDADYATDDTDFTGSVIIRANVNGNQTITLNKPSTELIGVALVIRKTDGVAGTVTHIKAGLGVALNAPDISPLRRVGSTVTAVYVGNGVFDLFGELP